VHKHPWKLSSIIPFLPHHKMYRLFHFKLHTIFVPRQNCTHTIESTELQPIVHAHPGDVIRIKCAGQKIFTWYKLGSVHNVQIYHRKLFFFLFMATVERNWLQPPVSRLAGRIRPSTLQKTLTPVCALMGASLFIAVLRCSE
jgi:hypothetical protein